MNRITTIRTLSKFTSKPHLAIAIDGVQLGLGPYRFSR
jgi:hypothetical protein